MRVHHRLDVWQRSIDFAEKIYKAVGSFPRNEEYGLGVQLKRAAVSIPSNIAEDAVRKSKREFTQFLYPVPQNVPPVSAGMNPVSTPSRENDAFPIQSGWNGVNVLNFPEGQCPKATDVSPWYGVYVAAGSASEMIHNWRSP